ncbi:OsmC family peroxiredoxin [Kitasatospora sp. NPDC001159]
MATTCTASTVWKGALQDGRGLAFLRSSGVAAYPVSRRGREQESSGVTSPEELIAAAHSSCFCMTLSQALTEAGTPPLSLTARANVTFHPGVGITGVALTVSGTVPGVSVESFTAAAEDAKRNCPVSQALAAVPITLVVNLLA